MLEYTVLCIVLSLICLGFIPAMIASAKNYSFLKWYGFGVVLFPVALVSAILLKKPVRIVNVLSSKDHSRKRRQYRLINKEKTTERISLGYILAVIFTKAIFSAFAGLIAFALSRVFLNDSVSLRITCVTFGAILTVLLSITEIWGFSRLPILADEITKRALQIFVISAVVSLPMFLAKNFITSHITKYQEFVRFLCTLTSFVAFLLLLFRMQRRYYGIFSKFFDYCTISLCSYVVFSAVTMVFLSLSKKIRWAVYAFAMQMQLLNFSYFSEIKHIVNPKSLIVAAVVHLIARVLLLFSGLRCKAYKKKELEYRIEDRTKAFRTSQKRALRRHIPKTGMTMTRPVK